MASSEGLCAADFTRIAGNGFGDTQNSYAHSMCFFQDHVYVGTTRHILSMLKLFPPLDPSTMDPWPVEVPPAVEDLDLRSQIWRLSIPTGQWRKMHTSPEIKGKNGKKVPRDLGYRGITVFRGRSDEAPTLYVSALSTVVRGAGARILRSQDGEKFTPIGEPGLGNPNVCTFRSMETFDGHLYVVPVGEGMSWNTAKNPVILRSDDPVMGKWELACKPGFGDPANTGVFEMAIFNDHLYAGTFNHTQGYQVWKTPATGAGPCRWVKVVEQGASRGPLNQMAMSMCVLDDALYVGSGIQNGGYDRNNMVGPAAAELIRLYPDDTWDLVVGTARDTPQGFKSPLSGLGPGFGNFFNGYLWRMAVHHGWLYAGTFDWSVFLPYGQKRRMFLWIQRMIRDYGVDQIVKYEGGFDLWRSRDGVQWEPVSRTGFDNPYNYGVRTMVSTPLGLFVGTANPFGPKIPARIASGWTYVPNPRGGAEVWLGA